MRFLVDMPLSPGLADWLAGQGHEAVHASRIGLAQAPDEAILAHAMHEHYVVVTADLDYPRLLALAGAEGPGVILFRAGDWSEEEAVTRLAAVLQAIPLSELPTSLVTVERGRIRRRRLPLDR